MPEEKIFKEYLGMFSIIYDTFRFYFKCVFSAIAFISTSRD